MSEGHDRERELRCRRCRAADDRIDFWWAVFGWAVFLSLPAAAILGLVEILLRSLSSR